METTHSWHFGRLMWYFPRYMDWRLIIKSNLFEVCFTNRPIWADKASEIGELEIWVEIGAENSEKTAVDVSALMLICIINQGSNTARSNSPTNVIAVFCSTTFSIYPENFVQNNEALKLDLMLLKLRLTRYTSKHKQKPIIECSAGFLKTKPPETCIDHGWNSRDTML